MEVEGSIETSRARQSEQSLKGVVERKSVMLVWELKGYSVFAAAVSETKWFGKNVYEIEDHVMLQSGKQTPGVGEPVKRGEGVGIILNKDTAKAWREGGEQWNPISSRILSARLKLQEDKRRRRPRFLSIISVYAPTFRSPQDEKDRFFEDLQKEIGGIVPSDILIVMRDLNVRVGSNDENTGWNGALGMHGLGEMNEAGLSLLSFCCMNNIHTEHFL